MSDVLTLWDQGHDTLEIARLLNTTEATVYNALARRKRQLSVRRPEWGRLQRQYAKELCSAGIKGGAYRKAMGKFIAELGA